MREISYSDTEYWKIRAITAEGALASSGEARQSDDKVRSALVLLVGEAESIGQHLVYNAPTKDFAEAIKAGRSALSTPTSQP
jgi:hypothetical protein